MAALMRLLVFALATAALLGSSSGAQADPPHDPAVEAAVDGIIGFADKVGALSSAEDFIAESPLGTEVPLTGIKAHDLLNLADLLEDSLNNELSDDATYDWLVAQDIEDAINAASGTAVAGITVNFTNVDVTEDDNFLDVDFAVAASGTLNRDISYAANSNQLPEGVTINLGRADIAFQAAVDTTVLHFRLDKSKVNADYTLDPGAFFLEEAPTVHLRLDAAANITDLRARLPFAELDIDGTANIDLDVDVAFQDVDGLPNLTQDEIAAASLADLVSIDFVDLDPACDADSPAEDEVEVNLNLNIQPDSLLPANPDATMQICDGNLGDGLAAPTFNADFGELANLANISPEQILGGLANFIAGLAGAENSGGGGRLPFLKEKLSDAFKVAKPLEDFVRSQLEGDIVCGTENNEPDPPTGSVEDLASGTEVFCQAITAEGPIVGVDWTSDVASEDANTDAPPPASGGAFATVGPDPTETAEFTMTTAGDFDVELVFETDEDVAEDPAAESHLLVPKIKDLKDLFERLAAAAGLDQGTDGSNPADGSGFAYDSTRDLLTYRVVKSNINPSPVSAEIDFGDKLHEKANLLGLSPDVEGGAAASIDAGGISFDLTFGAILSDSINDITPADPADTSVADRFYLQVDPAGPEFKVQDLTAQVTVKLKGRLGPLEVSAEGTGPDGAQLALAKVAGHASDPVVAVDINPEAGGIPLTAGSIANAIQVSKLLATLGQAPTPSEPGLVRRIEAKCNLALAPGGIVVKATMGGDQVLAEGRVDVEWGDVFGRGDPGNEDCIPDLKRADDAATDAPDDESETDLEVTPDVKFNANLKPFDFFPTVRGTHTAATGNSMTDATKNFTNAGDVGNVLNSTIRNKTTGASCTILTLTGDHTVDCTLTGGNRPGDTGNNNKWKLGDEYEIEGNAFGFINLILDNLDELVDGLDELGVPLDQEIPLLGITPRELVQRIQNIKVTIDELRGLPAGTISCGPEYIAGTPQGDPTSLPDGTSLLCELQTTEEPDEGSVVWRITKGGTVETADGSDGDTTEGRDLDSTAGTNPSLPVEFTIDDPGTPEDPTLANEYQIHAEWTDASGTHTADFPPATPPDSLQKVEQLIEGKLGIDANALRLELLDIGDTITTGTHDGDDGAANLTDSNADFNAASVLEANTVRNKTTGAYCRIAEVTGTDNDTLECALRNGDRNDDGDSGDPDDNVWDDGDEYVVFGDDTTDLVTRLRFGYCTKENTTIPNCTEDQGYRLVDKPQAPLNFDLGDAGGLAGLESEDAEFDLEYSALGKLDFAIALKFALPSPKVLDGSGIDLKAAVNGSNLNLSANIGPLTANLGTQVTVIEADAAETKHTGADAEVLTDAGADFSEVPTGGILVNTSNDPQTQCVIGEVDDTADTITCVSGGPAMEWQTDEVYEIKGAGIAKLQANFSLRKDGVTTPIDQAFGIGEFLTDLSPSFDVPDSDCGGQIDDGGTPVDLEGDACAKLSAEVEVLDVAQYIGEFKFLAPELLTPSDWIFELPDGLNALLTGEELDWTLFLQVLEKLLDKVETELHGSAQNVSIPVIGDALDAGADIAGKLEQLVAEFNDVIAEIESAANVECATPDADGVDNNCDDVDGIDAFDIARLARNALFDLIGNESPVVAELLRDGPDASNDISRNDIVVTPLCGTPTPSACADEASPASISDLRITLRLGQGILDESAGCDSTDAADCPVGSDVPFDLGLDGLPLRIAGTITPNVSWQLLMDFGISRTDGPYLVTSGPAPITGDHEGTSDSADLVTTANLSAFGPGDLLKNTSNGTECLIGEIQADTPAAGQRTVKCVPGSAALDWDNTPEDPDTDGDQTEIDSFQIVARHGPDGHDTSAGHMPEIAVEASVGIGDATGEALSDCNDRDPVAAAQAELTGFSATRCIVGDLAFLAVTIRDGDDESDPDKRPSKVGIRASLDLSADDPSSRRLSFPDLVAGKGDLSFRLGADANIDIRVRTGLRIGEASGFPSVVGRFHLDWNWAIGDTNPSDNLPTGIEFDGLYLDIGSFISDFLEPIAKQVKKIASPFLPIIDVLQAPLPVISDLSKLVGGDDITLIDIIEAVSGNDLSMVRSILAFVKFVANLPSGNILVGLGDPLAGVAGAFNVSETKAKAGPLTPNQANTLIKSTPAPTAGTNLISGVSGANSAPVDGRPTTFGVPGLSFPFTSNAMSIFGVLMGADVTLVRWDAGVMRASAGVEYDFGPIMVGPVPITITIGGSVGIEGRFAIGYDTFGLRQFINGGPVESLLGGIFIDDLDANGNDVPEVKFIGTVWAAAAVDLVIVSAGVEGGIELTTTLDLDDRPEPDGKLRIHEILDKISNPICLFIVSGKLEAFLAVFVKIDLVFYTKKYRFELVRVTLLEFSGACDPPEPNPADVEDVVDANGDPYDPGEEKDGVDDLVLNIGDRADRRGIQVGEEEEEILVRQIPSVGGKPTFSISIFGAQEEHSIDAGGWVVANADAEADVVSLEPGATTNDNGTPGDTNDDTQTIIPFTQHAVLNGQDGDDELRSGDGADKLTGGDGNDTIAAGGGNDISVDGGAHEDQVDGGFGNDGTASSPVRGGSGDDKVTGGPGADHLDGGADNDTLAGGPGLAPNDPKVVGDASVTPAIPANASLADGADTITGGTGEDSVEGGFGNDFLYGDTNPAGNADSDCANSSSGLSQRDVLDGGKGNDSLFGGPDADRLFGNNGGGVSNETENDRLCGNGGDDDLFGGLGSDDMDGGSDNDNLVGGRDNSTGAGVGTGDDMDGGSGRDYLLGDEGTITRGTSGNSTLAPTGSFIGNDDMLGGSGLDVMQGQSGQDDMDGGADADVMNGGNENDEMNGGTGDDEMLGENGIDTMFGDAGGDLMRGGLLGDVMFGDEDGGAASGEDEMYGDSGTDRMHGGPAADDMFGGPDIDTMYGDGGTDTMQGDAANDRMYGGADNDQMHGNAGQDYVEGNGNGASPAGGDHLFGDENEDRLVGGTTYDGTIFGNADTTPTSADDGGDTLTGGDANDVLIGDNGTIAADPASVGECGETLIEQFSEGGADTMYGDDPANAALQGEDCLFGEFDNDEIHGGPLNDYAEGNAGSDSIFGEDGEDDLIGGGNDAGGADAGETIVSGGAGIDYIAGDNAQITTNSPRNVVLLDLNSTNGDLAGNDILNGDGAEDVMYGQGENDTMDGGAADDYMEGNTGKDSMQGGAGADDMLGGSGHDNGDDDGEPANFRELDFVDDESVADLGDQMWGGNDPAASGDGVDFMAGDNANITRPSAGVRLIELYNVDFVHVSPDPDPILSGNDTMHGNASNDVMYGQGDNDTMFGDEDADYMEGNTGRDIMEGNADDDDMVGGSGRDNGGDGGAIRRLENAVDENVLGIAVGDETDGDQMFGNAALDGNAAADADDYMAGDNAFITRNSPRSIELYDVPFAGGPAIGGLVSGDDFMHGNGDGDVMYGQGDLDQMFGDAGDDYMEGNSHDDFMEGNADEDDMLGGSGHDNADDDVEPDDFRELRNVLDSRDTMFGNDGVDYMGGDNANILRAGGPKNYDEEEEPSAGRSVELYDVQLADGAAIAPGVSGGDTMEGNAGNDVIFGQGNGSQPASQADPADDIDNDRDGREDGNASDAADRGYDCNDGAADTTVFLADPNNDGDAENLVDAADPQCDAAIDEDADWQGDLIHGNEGHDYIEGNHGSDWMFGDGGEDDMAGGGSADDGKVYDAETGDPIADRTAGGLLDGHDVMWGNEEDDSVVGDNGAHTRPTDAEGAWTKDSGGNGFNQFERTMTMSQSPEAGAAHGNDYLRGNEGNDDMFGQLGNDYMQGDADEDAMLGDLGQVENQVIPGTGSGTFIDINPPFIEEFIDVPGTLKRVVTLYAHNTDVAGAGGGADTMLGNEGNDKMHGGPGPDLMQGNGDTPDPANASTPPGDFLFGGDGDDALWGGRGHDHLFGGWGNDFHDVAPRPYMDLNGDTVSDVPQDLPVWFELAGAEHNQGLDFTWGGRDKDAHQASFGRPGPRPGDRLIDAVGNTNIFYTCPGAYGEGVINRDELMPDMRLFLQELAAGDGAVETLDPNSSGGRELSILFPGDESGNPPYPGSPGHFTCPPSDPGVTAGAVTLSSQQITAGDQVTINAKIGNEAPAATGAVVVRFAVNGVEIGRQTVEGIEEGGTETASQVWNTRNLHGPQRIEVTIDPDNTITGENEENNAASLDATVQGTDAAIAPADVKLSRAKIVAGDKVDVTATVRNPSSAPAYDVIVKFTDNGAEIGSRTIGEIAPGGSATATVRWRTNKLSGAHTVAATADPDNGIAEVDESNNAAGVVTNVIANKVKNGVFEPASLATPTAPEAWTGTGTSTSYALIEDDWTVGSASSSSFWMSEPMCVVAGATYELGIDSWGGMGVIAVKQYSSTDKGVATNSFVLQPPAGSWLESTNVVTMNSKAATARLMVYGGLNGQASSFTTAQLSGPDCPTTAGTTTASATR